MSVVTLFHFYCGLRPPQYYGRYLGRSCSSNPFPFLLWIATHITRFTVGYTSRGSNPFPFLLWIATLYEAIIALPCIACSNPFPFLLWIATSLNSCIPFGINIVVTLFHFYCGLRQQIPIIIVDDASIAVVTLFHFYCGLRQIRHSWKGTWSICSNPFPFLLWIATKFMTKHTRFWLTVVTLFHFYCGLRQFFQFYTFLRHFLVVTLFHFYCGLRRINYKNFYTCRSRSNPFPFLLWIATLSCVFRGRWTAWA